MEQVNFRNGCHFFTACRTDRPESSYKIDFALEQALDYIPALRYRCSLNGQALSRINWSLNLDARQLALVQQVDGKRPIRKIAAHLASFQMFRDMQPSEFEAYVQQQFRALWQLDFLAMHLTQ